MDRGVHTRGKVARLVAGAESVEIKATVPQQQIEGGLRRFGLNAGNDEERFIYFFDTPELQLFKAGVVARARRIVGGEHDSTVKFRPVDPATIDKKWQKYKGFKIEADASEKGVVKSASLTMPVEKGLIKRVLEGKKRIPDLFSEEQKAFLLETAKARFDFDRVIVMGPMRAWRWKFEDPGLPWPLTAELWQRDDGATVLEASIKSPVVQAAAAGGGFLAFLAELGAERDNDQQAKTRWALDYFAARARGSLRSKPATGRATAAATRPRGRASRK
ncbi:MAG: hypothetical protein MUF79_04580 [Burkholderiales bacterium]|jgi:hypothetical protein|nr:hypothetical protein [Burkholderiales bacterium]